MEDLVFKVTKPRCICEQDLVFKVAGHTYVRLTTGPVPPNRPIPTNEPIPITGPNFIHHAHKCADFSHNWAKYVIPTNGPILRLLSQ